LAASAQAAQLAPKPITIGVGAAPPLCWCAMAADAVGAGAAGATNRAIGTGATVFRTGVPTTLGLKVGAIPTQIGALNRLGEVGVTNRIERRVFSRWPTMLNGAL